MKKVVLMGDSIRMIGYGKRVEELLGNPCTVWQPEENCRFAKYTLRMLFDYQQDIKDADVIHWNNGLWDICDIFGDGPFTPLEEYVENMLRIADLLQSYGRKVIFATTTPIRPDHPHYTLERIQHYNEAVVPVLRARGVEINDLFSVMVDHIIDGICEDRVHLNSVGIELCAVQTVRKIKEAMGENVC